MEAQLIVIERNDFKQLGDLKAYLQDKDYVAYDLETTGLTKYDAVIGFSVCAEDNVAYYVILAEWNKETSILEFSNDSAWMPAVVDLISDLKQKKLICHNAVFDCAMSEHALKVRLIEALHTDTMLLAHLLNENRRVGLKELGKYYFGEDADAEQAEMKASVLVNGGQLTKDCYELYKADARLLGKYGAKDALLTYKLFFELIPDLYEQKLDKFFYEEESMPLLKGPTYELNTTGLQVDLAKLELLKKQLESECLEAKDFILQETKARTISRYPGTNKKNVFNLGSSSQLSWLLFGALQLEFNTLTKEGKNVCKALGLRLPYTYKAKRDFITVCLDAVGREYAPAGTTFRGKVRAKKIKEPWSYIACDKRTLKKLSGKYLWIERLLDYQRKMKLLNTYVASTQERTRYGILQPSFLQHGTSSGRYASRSPNLQNLPRDDQRIKECFISRPGKSFVSADYSQLEPRVFSYYSQDTRLMSAFDGTSDFYSVVGMGVFDVYDCVPQKDGVPNAFGVKYKKLRDLSKVIALATAHGATPHQLAPTVGKSIEDTADDMERYFEKFPGVKTMMTDAHNKVKKDGFVTSLFGRPRRIPEAKKITKLYGNVEHAELPYEARKLLNMACNHRIQSTGASIVNRAAIKFFNDVRLAGIECKLILQVHDELIIECADEDANDVAVLLQNAMQTATQLKGIELEAIPRVSKNLSK